MNDIKFEIIDKQSVPAELKPVSVAKHDPSHPYVRKLIGCGHGRLFSEPCQDCEIVKLHEQYTNAIRTVQIVRDRLRVLGAPLPGRLAL